MKVAEYLCCSSDFVTRSTKCNVANLVVTVGSDVFVVEVNQDENQDWHDEANDCAEGTEINDVIISI